MPTHPTAVAAAHKLHRLRRDADDIRAEIRKHDPSHLQTALVNHQTAGRRRPVPAGVVPLPPHPTELPHRQASNHLAHINPVQRRLDRVPALERYR
jgi:hypothetical protein